MSAHRSRYGIAAALAAGLVMTGMTTASAETPITPVPAPPTAPASDGGTEAPKDAPKADKMSSHSQELLVEAQSSGKAKVTVMMLAESGKTGAVVEQLKSLGASVGYVHEKTGYVRATIATRDALKVADIAQVQHVDLDETLSMPKPVADTPGPAVGSGKWTGPTATTPVDNPYMPIAETGAVKFRKNNPTFDGRGVTIGVLDSGVDLDHPALQKTTTDERKVVNWITATDPLTEGDGTWRVMRTRVAGPSATYAGAQWTLPTRDGADYAMNLLKESIAAGSDDVGGDLDRDGKTGGAWGVLYDYKSGDVWVDTNGNHDFTDEQVMRPYKERYDVGHLGKDDPATAIHESMPFVVEVRKDVDLNPVGVDEHADVVNIGMVASAHGTHVAGITAGYLPGVAMTGAAPGAKIVSAKACTYSGGCTSVALTEGMIELVANQRVDVVNMSIGGLPALNDGNTTRTALYNRLIDEYGVQFFISAGNEGPGTNTIGDPSVASDVVSVAAGASSDTWLSNYGAKATAKWWAQNYSSRGPREDGGFKPNIIAPGSAISSVPMFMAPSDIKEVSYKLPVGYAMFNGTSMAAPQATGAAALLLSAAKQSDVAVTPASLRAAIYTTADFIKGLDAASQGHGLIQVPAAWTILKKSPQVENAYTVSAPVCTPLGKLLAEPGKGVGLYNRCGSGKGGQKAGEARTYDVTITRTAGPAEQSKHTLTWVGNDGTFTSAKSVDLPLGKAVTVKVTAKPKAMGAHSAILEIDNAKTKWLDSAMMADVVVADELTAPAFSSTMSGRVERVRTQSLFVNVPEGAKALQVNLAGIANGSLVRWTAINPYGLPVEKPSGKGSCYTNDSDPKLCKPTSRSYTNPMPGIWELQVDASRKTPLTQNPFRLTAAVQGVTVEPATQTIESATVGKLAPVEWTVRNDFGTVAVTPKGGPLGSSFSARPTIKTGDKQTYTIDVPAGMTRLDVKIGNTSDKTADLDLYLKDASGTEIAKSAGGDSEESVSVANPAPGKYTVEIDGYNAGENGTEYDYLDVFFGKALGTLDVAGTTKTLKNGETMKVTGTVSAAAQVSEGRKLFGEMRIVSSEGAVLGSGQVVLGKVVTDAPAPAQPTTQPAPAQPVPAPTTQPAPTTTQPAPAPTRPGPTS